MPASLSASVLALGSPPKRPAAAAVGVKFTAAVADEHHLDLLLEGGQVGDIRHGDAAAAEDADVGELVEVGQGDLPGLHAAHGEAGHGPMGLVGQGAVVGINEGDQVVDQNPLESAEVEAPPRPPGPPVRAGRGRPHRRGHSYWPSR